MANSGFARLTNQSGGGHPKTTHSRTAVHRGNIQVSRRYFCIELLCDAVLCSCAHKTFDHQNGGGLIATLEAKIEAATAVSLLFPVAAVRAMPIPFRQSAA